MAAKHDLNRLNSNGEYQIGGSTIKLDEEDLIIFSGELAVSARILADPTQRAWLKYLPGRVRILPFQSLEEAINQYPTLRTEGLRSDQILLLSPNAYSPLHADKSRLVQPLVDINTDLMPLDNGLIIVDGAAHISGSKPEINTPMFVNGHVVSDELTVNSELTVISSVNSPVLSTTRKGQLEVLGDLRTDHDPDPEREQRLTLLGRTKVAGRTCTEGTLRVSDQSVSRFSSQVTAKQLIAAKSANAVFEDELAIELKAILSGRSKVYTAGHTSVRGIGENNLVVKGAAQLSTNDLCAKILRASQASTIKVRGMGHVQTVVCTGGSRVYMNSTSQSLLDVSATWLASFLTSAKLDPKVRFHRGPIAWVEAPSFEGPAIENAKRYPASAGQFTSEVTQRVPRWTAQSR